MTQLQLAKKIGETYQVFLHHDHWVGMQDTNTQEHVAWRQQGVLTTARMTDSPRGEWGTLKIPVALMDGRRGVCVQIMGSDSHSYPHHSHFIFEPYSQILQPSTSEDEV